MSAPRGMSTSRSMMARRMRACRPTRTPGIRMHCSMWQKLWTRTFGHSTLPEMLLPETMQPGEMTESSAWPQRLPGFGEHELRRRRLRLIRAQRPLRDRTG